MTVSGRLGGSRLTDLEPFRNVLFPLVYGGFFLGTLVALALLNRRSVRRLWLGAFFATLLVVTAVGMPLMPVVEMHKFSEPTDEEMTYYELRVVDADGDELYYDERAAPPMTGSRTSTIAGAIAEEYTDGERMEIGEFYLSQVREYRRDVESGESSVADRFSPPRYSDDERWTTEDLETYDEFEAIRVYERTVTYTDDNTAIESNEERRRVTIDVADQTVIEHDGEDA